MRSHCSLAESLASLTPAKRAKALAGLTEPQAKALLRDWRFWGRPDQHEPSGNWRTWLILAGRGWGKTRTGAETVRRWATSGRFGRIALVARTAADVRDVIVEGESGILAVHDDGERPVWKASMRRLEWPNGAIATTYSADEPDQLRGPQSDAAWCDELAAWRYPDAWDQLSFGLRLPTKTGESNRVVVTTTPRPTAIVRALAAAPDTVLTRGATKDNRKNLARGIVDDLERRYAGTRLGRQELDGEILDDNPGALWKRDSIDAARVRVAPDLRRIVVGVDPAVTSSAASDETGIVVAGLGFDGRYYVLGDYSGRYSPEQWASRVVKAYRDHKADRVVAEVNQGGDLVTRNLHTVERNLPVTMVHAKRAKALRAEPVSSLYEQAKVSHVGALAALEDQMTAWDPAGDDESPDRVDALVYALTELMGGTTVRADARPAARPIVIREQF